MTSIAAPERTEAGEYYFKYIDQVPAGEICETLIKQGSATRTLLKGISDQQSLHRYAPDKWTIREVVNHINDCERLFVGRAFWFARGFDTPLPSFDQNVAIATAEANDRSWSSHIEEFQAVRSATIAFFDNLPPGAWTKRGVASDNPFTVRALAYIAAGHVIHHIRILNERYGVNS